MRLSDRAILLSLRISQWSGMATEKDGARAIENAAAAQSGTVTARKQLMPDFPELIALQKFNTARRNEFNDKTLAYSDGTRLAPLLLAQDLIMEIGGWIDEGEKLADAVSNAYPDHLEAAEKKLGALFDRRLYPSSSQIRDKFSYRMTPTTVPESDQLRNFPGFDAAEVDKIVNTAEDALKAQMGEAMRDIWERIYNVTVAMAKRLEVGIGEKGAIFRDSLVGNVHDLADLLPKLNLFGDQAIDDMAKEMKRELCVVNTDMLREDPTVRAARAAHARRLAEIARNYL